MPDFYGGAGGLFGGLTQGLQLILALRNAEEQRRIRQGELDLDKKREGRVQAAQDIEQERAPYEDIQGQLNKRNIMADLPAIRREYTPTPEADTYQSANPFEGPQAFNAPPAPAAAPSFGAAPLQQSGPPRPSFNPATSHLAQVLERASRRSEFDLRKSALDQALNSAAVQAQETQLPVIEGLPQGFEAQPDKTFTPYQMSPRPDRPDPLDNIFGPLLNNPVNAKILQKTDPITYREFEAWKARRIGSAGAGAPSPKTAQQHIDDILQEHPSWTDQQVADEVRRRMATP